LLGYVDGYKIFYSEYYKVTVVDPEGRIVWSIPLRYYSSVALGKDFLIVANPDEDMYKVNVTIYLPKTNETFQYFFPLDRPNTIIKAVANGSYAVVGVPYTWMLYYFKREKLLWEGSLSIECGYEDYPYFTLHLSRNGFGYAISSDGYAVTFFSPNMWGSFFT